MFVYIQDIIKRRKGRIENERRISIPGACKDRRKHMDMVYTIAEY